MTARTPGNDLTTAAIKCLAGIHEARGEYSSAWPLLTKAVILDRAMLGSEHPEVARDLNNLAGVYHAVGSYAQAEALVSNGHIALPPRRGSGAEVFGGNEGL